MWKDKLVEFGVPVAKYIAWMGDGKEKYWPRFLLMCMAGKYPPEANFQSEGLKIMRRYAKDFFSATPNGNPVAKKPSYDNRSQVFALLGGSEVSAARKAMASGDTSTGALQTMSSSKSGVQTLSEKPPEPHRSSEDYLRVSTAFLNKNLRTLQEFAPQLDPSGGEAKTYDDLLQCVNGGASVDFFEDIESEFLHWRADSEGEATQEHYSFPV